MSRRMLLIGLLSILVGALAAPLLVSGQSEETILTIAVPDWMVQTVFTPEVFKAFEANHPNTKVIVKTAGEAAYAPPPEYALEEYLDMMATYASTGDLLFVGSYNLAPEATRAGYFLDLAPLVAADPALDETDFFPAIWHSWQWDGGIWGMPLAASVNLLVYNVDAFDAANLTYPSGDWILDDLLHAADVLAQRNTDGTIVVPGMEPNFFGELVRSLLGESLFDDSVQPSPPDFARPEIATLLESWHMWLQSGGRMPGGPGQYVWDQVPMAIDDLGRIYAFGDNSDGQWAASLLPGGTAIPLVQGIAVSAGTAHPELAYALAKYLTRQPQVIGQFFATVPARQSLMGMPAQENAFGAPAVDVPPEIQAFQKEALANALPISELQYADYLNVAVGLLFDDTQPYDAASALQAAEEQARVALQTAEARRESLVLVIPTPVPTPALAPGETALQFGLRNMSPLPNEESWQQAALDFAASDPEVGYVELAQDPTGATDPLETSDCYYLPYSSPSLANVRGLLSLDPFMDADPGFDPHDVIGNALDHFRFDNAIWAYPLTMHPAVMWYNPDTFAQADVPIPDDGWSIEAFGDALVQLKATLPDGAAPLVPEDMGNIYMQMLIAGYGGLPFDYHTDPPEVHLTKPETVEAIRQAASLATDGYIAYRSLGSMSGGGGGGPAALATSVLTANNWRLRKWDELAEYSMPVQLTLYPRGSRYMPVSYDLGAAYISARTLNPDGCYRWIRYLAQQPDLFGTMPVSRTMLESQALSAALGDDLAAFYRQYAALFDDPSLLIVPYGTTSIGGWIEQLWFNRVFDRIVLEEGDLETELAEAEANILAFRACTSEIPPLEIDAPFEAGRAQYARYADCAIKIDPGLEARLSPGS